MFCNMFLRGAVQHLNTNQMRTAAVLCSAKQCDALPLLRRAGLLSAMPLRCHAGPREALPLRRAAWLILAMPLLRGALR